MNNIKKIIKAHMALNDLTQLDMAELLGVTRQTFNMKLNGHIAFSDKEKIVIADLFKSDVGNIFFNNKCDNLTQMCVTQH